MLILELVVALILALGAGDALPVAGGAANTGSFGEGQIEYQRPKKEEQPQPITWGQLKSMYK